MSGRAVGLVIAVVTGLALAASQSGNQTNPSAPPIQKPPKPGKPKPGGGGTSPATPTGDHNGVLGGIQATAFGAGRRYSIGVIAPKGTGPDGVINAFDRQGWADIDLTAAPPINSTSEAWLGEATWNPAPGVDVTPKLHFEGLIITMMQGPLT